MAEIAAVEGNGLTAVSTFSGCGGGCLGLKMAGYKILWASEFIEAAAETYAANNPEVPLSTSDIREVKSAQILQATGLEQGELDLLEGSPPCSSFSAVGKGAAHWGQVKKYSEGAQRSDDLFFEFTRLLAALKPRAFAAENVAGLTRGAAKGFFKRIHAALKEAGYVVEASIVDAQWLGVPQVRPRVIFLGIRKDLGTAPAFPTPLAYRYSIRDAIGNGIPDPDLPSPDITGYAIYKEWLKTPPGIWSRRYFNLMRPRADEPCPTVTQLGGNVGAASVTHPDEPRKFSIAELRRICGFPDDFVLTGSYQQQYERLGRAVPPPMMRAIGAALAEQLS